MAPDAFERPSGRDFRGAMAGRVDKGLLITTGTFTAEATKKPPARTSRSST